MKKVTWQSLQEDSDSINVIHGMKPPRHYGNATIDLRPEAVAARMEAQAAAEKALSKSGADLDYTSIQGKSETGGHVVSMKKAGAWVQLLPLILVAIILILATVALLARMS